MVLEVHIRMKASHQVDQLKWLYNASSENLSIMKVRLKEPLQVWIQMVSLI